MRQPTASARAKPAPRRKERTKGELVVPDFMLRLMEHIGPSAASKLIGVTPGTLHKARNAGAVSKHIEVASRGIWMEQGYGDVAVAHSESAPPATRTLAEAVHAPTSESTALMLVQVPKGSAPMLLKTAEMLGATVVVQG